MGAIEGIDRALARIEGSESTREAAAIFLECCLPAFDFCGFAVVKSSRIRGWLSGPGKGFDSSGFEQLEFAPEGSMLGRAVAAGSYLIGQRPDDRVLLEWYRGRGRKAPKECLAMPVKAGERIVAVFYGDNRTPRVQPSLVADLLRLCVALGRMFERRLSVRRTTVETSAPLPVATLPVATEQMPATIEIGPAAPPAVAPESAFERANAALKGINWGREYVEFIAKRGVDAPV